MTDTSLLATTHSTGDSYPVTAPIHSPVPNGAISDSVPLEDEEPYTIKCICAYQDDDGNTVFCEKCETWQHIECYYHGQEVPDEHFCTDCSPSPLYLDGKRATERQRRLREQSDSGDRKAKRSGSKTQKKKQQHKDQELTNGHHRSESSSRDQPGFVKKSKPSHKPSASVSSISGVPKLQPESRKRSGSMTISSPTKPSTTPQIPLYSHEFLHLYDDDRGYVNMKSNLVVNIQLLGDMGAWVKDASALLQANINRQPQDIFTYADADVLDPSHLPKLELDTIVDKDLEFEGIHPTWKALKTQTEVRKDQIVGEVKGKIGKLRDYCLDTNNRWPELRHPQPFVFFHPQLPIYIDSREEGSILRYVRRSCRPNVTMKTCITNEVEYHFCYVANQDIPAGSEITAMWYLDPQLFGSNNLGKQEAGDSDQEEARAITISNFLAHFGGCACVPPQSCLMAAVDRRRHPSTKTVNGKRKKAKSKSALSPTSVGRSTSRAGSEAAVDDDNADNRSTSGSVRGQTRSRDLTPTHPPPDWALQDTELSARDRRKIAAVERKFEQLEHDQHGGPRKKKRSSATSSQPSLPTPLPKTASSSKSLKLDTANHRLSEESSISPYHRGQRPSPRKSSDNVNTANHSPLTRASYVDGSQQTRHQKIGFSPLGRRLLKRCHEDSSKAQWPLKRQENPPGLSIRDVTASQSPGSQSQPWSSVRPTSSHSGEDVEMKDAGVDSNSSPSLPFPNDVMSKPPLPSTAAHNTLIPGMSPNKHRSGGLHVQLPPNQFAVPSAITHTLGTATRGSLQSPSDVPLQSHPVQTPGGSITTPSPAKKKMSLGDYLGRRGTMATPTVEKSQSQASASLAPPSKPIPHHHSSTPPLSTDGESQAVPGTEIIKNEGSPTDTDVTMKDVSSKPPISPPYYSTTLGMQDDNKVPPTT